MSEEKNNPEEELEKEDFKNAVEANQKTYSSHRNTLVVRLIGFIAGLFTLLQTVQNSITQPLSKIFSNELPRFDTLDYIGGLFPWKFIVFFASVSFLLFLIFRTFFRFSLISKYINQMYLLTEDDTKRFQGEYEYLKNNKMPLKVIEATGMKIVGKLAGQEKGEKLLIFPYSIFISGVSWTRPLWGHIVCLGISLLSAIIIVGLLW